MKRAAPLLLIALIALGGCFWRGRDRPEETGLIYSPNGEPLSGGPLGHPECEAALGRWFDRLVAGHGGTIDEAAFLADARHQFDAMDLDKTGVLTPAGLAQYRAPYETDRRLPQDHGAPARGTRRRAADERAAIAEDRADPVMLADVGLRNRITRADFLAYVRRNFALLDTNRDGRLSRAEVLAVCQSAP